MSVNLTISETAGGTSIADTIDLDTSVSLDEDTDYQDLFISHDGNLSITDCYFYANQYVGSSYPGTPGNEAADLVELLSWGDAVTGGIKLVQNGWGSWVSGENTTGTWTTLSNSAGDINHPIILDEDAITTGTPDGDGVVPSGGEAHIQCKVTIPSSVTRGTGYRAFSLVMAYSATS